MKKKLIAVFLIIIIYCGERSVNPEYTRDVFLGNWSWYNHDSSFSEHYSFTESNCIYESYIPIPSSPYLNKKQAYRGIKFDSWFFSEGELILQSHSDTVKYRCTFEGNMLIFCYDSSNLWRLFNIADTCVEYIKE